MKYTYINETMKDELGELLTNDANGTINAAMQECANAGYRKGLIGCIAALGIGLLVGMNAKQIRGDYINKHIQKTVSKITRDVCSGK